MKKHTGMEAHDGFAPHSHEVRADHRGVPGREPGSYIYYPEGKELITACGHPFATCHTDRCFRAGDPVVAAIVTNLEGKAPEPEARNGIDRNDIPMPDGWAVYFDGELVFSVDEDKWRQIGPGIEKIMEG